MIQEKSYKTKYAELAPWLNEILQLLKKDLKNEHLKKDQVFSQKYFQKKFLDKVTTEELVAAYRQELLEGNEELGEWIASRWIMKRGEVYQLFAHYLASINPNFEEIQEVTSFQAKSLIDASVARFGAVTTYIFSVINGVVFAEADLEALRAQAEEVAPQVEEAVSSALSPEAVDKLMLKLTDKYEQRLCGMQKKYTQDVEGLKKQIAQLQRKLSAQS